MKTIEELTNEYADEQHEQMFFSENEYSKYSIRDAFLAGIKAVQGWISVEDELPKWGEIILVKINNEDDMLSTARHQGNGHFAVDCQELYRYNVTHWRPIEYK